MTPPLYAHQNEGVAFLMKRKGSGCLFHEMGLGKTRTALEAYLMLRQITPGLKMLVVAPLSLLNAAWREDTRKFTNLTFRNLHDEKIPEAWVTDVWAINYESLIQAKNFTRLHSYLYRNPVMLVCDESSRMKTQLSLPRPLLGLWFPLTPLLLQTPNLTLQGLLWLVLT